MSVIELPSMSEAGLRVWTAIERELVADASLSDREIARRAGGCSNHTVAKVRALFREDASALRAELHRREDPGAELREFFAGELRGDYADLDAALLARKTSERGRPS